jgi:hypothetical protein
MSSGQYSVVRCQDYLDVSADGSDLDYTTVRAAIDTWAEACSVADNYILQEKEKEKAPYYDKLFILRVNTTILNSGVEAYFDLICNRYVCTTPPPSPPCSDSESECVSDSPEYL